MTVHRHQTDFLRLRVGKACVLIPRSSFRRAHGVINRRHRISVGALDVEALAAVGDGADEDGFPGAVVVAWVGFGAWRRVSASRGTRSKTAVVKRRISRPF